MNFTEKIFSLILTNGAKFKVLQTYVKQTFYTGYYTVFVELNSFDEFALFLDQTTFKD